MSNDELPPKIQKLIKNILDNDMEIKKVKRYEASKSDEEVEPVEEKIVKPKKKKTKSLKSTEKVTNFTIVLFAPQWCK